VTYRKWSGTEAVRKSCHTLNHTTNSIANWKFVWRGKCPWLAGRMNHGGRRTFNNYSMSYLWFGDGVTPTGSVFPVLQLLLQQPSDRGCRLLHSRSQAASGVAFTYTRRTYADWELTDRWGLPSKSAKNWLQYTTASTQPETRIEVSLTRCPIHLSKPTHI
jgi:hypothetical protein